MKSPVHLAEVFIGDMGVDLGGRDIGVAEEGLIMVSSLLL